LNADLVDAAGLEHLFVEKGPIVSSEDLWTDTAYPQPGKVACTVVEEHAGDPPVVTVDTAAPSGIASKDGMTRFDILRRDLVDF